MEQLNTVLPSVQEENKPAVQAAFEGKREPALLNKVRSNYAVYGGVSLVFGGFFTLLFYKAWIGLNVLLFSLLIVILIFFIMKKFSLRIKTGTKLLFAGVILLALSICLTANETLQLLNMIGILFLLDLSLLHQLNEDSGWSFLKNVGRMFGMLPYSIASISMPFIDGINYLKHTKIFKNDLLRNILIGTAVSIPVLFVITVLLSSADLLFHRLTSNIFHTIFSADIIGILFMLFLGFLACYCILSGALSMTGLTDKKPSPKADTTAAVTFLSLLCLVYAVFCGIQLVYLFAGGIFTLPDGFTFAQYARRGFFELLAVTIINIVIMLLCSALFKESRLLRFLVIFMTACTYIMIASAAYRMFLYIDAYHLTFLRLFVLLTLLIDAFVLAGLIISEYNKKFRLFPYCVAVISICYIAFSFSKPDYYIASFLISREEKLTLTDMVYLTQDLSLDAAPIVADALKDEDRWISDYAKNTMKYSEKIPHLTTNQGTYGYYFSNYEKRLKAVKGHIGIRDFNYSCYKAYGLSR